MTPPETAEALIRRYYAACNAADAEALASCFTENAVHYFPPGFPGEVWRGRDALVANWTRFARRLNGHWTVDRLLSAPDGREAVIEWTNFTDGRLTRGDEWYLFDERIERIREIRAYFAAPLDAERTVHELAGFDYTARGYPTERPT
ncbi:MAG TPA: nuclear transport factor 2 family protein [Paracoccaceae bacterium]|nr:nuclear transport factor 2 family protein [Paracoccaceae bacterium]